MSEKLRRTGLEVVGDVPWGTHFCQFYQTAQDLLDILVPYFTEGLKANEFCVWVTSEPLGVAAARKAMAAALPDFEDFVRRGQIEIVPHTDWYLKGGTFDAARVLNDWVRKLDEALAAGYEGLRLTGNTFWLEQKDWRAFTDYEAAVDGVIGRYRMIALCTYAIDRCGFNEILDVIRNHRFALVRREGRWELVENAERQRAQEELKRLAQFPAQNPNPILRVTAGGDVLYANAAARALLERMGWKENTPLPPSLRAIAPKAEGRAGAVEAEVMCDRGRTYWFAAVRPAGESYINLYARDITERKKAEEALRTGLQRFYTVLSSMYASILLVADDGRIEFANQAFCDLFGLKESPAALTRINSPEMIEKIKNAYLHPEEEAARITEIVRRGQPVKGEEIVMQGGRTCLMDFVPLTVDGKSYGRLWYHLEITERKKTEALRQALAEQERLRLGAAVEQASDSVVMLDLDGTIRYVNAAFVAINRMPRDEAVGRSYFVLLAGDAAAAAVRESVAKGAAWHGHLTRPVPNGRPVELEVTISPAADPSGTVIGGLVTERDVTQENALQRQVRQSQKMEALGTLAGGITHDFNNILGAIIINTELALLDLEPSHPSRAPLPTVLQAANRGKELVKQIITFSRQREWERKPLEMVPVAKEALTFLRSTLPKDVAIHEMIAPDSGTVRGDPSQIHQIIVNLCQNAALAMADKGGDLEVKLEPVEVDMAMVVRHPELKAGPFVRLMVADTGCGMSRELMERIFEPFFTTRGPGGGSGLGLAVVHGIVRSYHGAVTVYSEPGKGSVFSVYLPRLKGENLSAETAQPLQPVRGHERILLVEDEVTQRASLARSLTRLGYRVTARAAGRSALTAFRKDPEAFDLVITDQSMPQMSGLELAAALVKIRPDIPLLLCTGFSEKVHAETVGQNGIREFVMKPFTLQEISRLIRKALKKGG